MPTMLGRPSDWTMTVNISDKALGDANLPLGAALAVVMLIITGVILLLSFAVSGKNMGATQSAIRVWSFLRRY